MTKERIRQAAMELAECGQVLVEGEALAYQIAKAHGNALVRASSDGYWRVEARPLEIAKKPSRPRAAQRREKQP